ncbi:MAG: hypothetical protein JXC31_05875, partial [Acholeplasmataceae bacterium]|nr:hypothetical protein [Acholeplasmataceae bacterium]
MIYYLYIHLFYSKKRRVLLIALMVFALLMLMMVYTDESMIEQILYQEQNQLYYEQVMTQLLKLLCPLLVILLVMDHDQEHLKPLVSYFGRSKIIFNKLIFYILILCWFYFIFFLFYHLFPLLLTSYYIYDAYAVKLFLNLFLDGILLAFLVFIFIRDKHKALSILIAIFYIVMSIIQEDHQNLFLFYLFPIFSPY